MVSDVDLVLVRFTQANAPYMAREIAGFDPVTAKRFVDRKRAVYYTPPAEDQPEAEVEVKATPEADSLDSVAPTAAIVPKKLSGPWFMVGDEKIKGRAKAEARAAELNEAREVK
jgi:hypothetical protein